MPQISGPPTWVTTGRLHSTSVSIPRLVVITRSSAGPSPSHAVGTCRGTICVPRHTFEDSQNPLAHSAPALQGPHRFVAVLQTRLPQSPESTHSTHVCDVESQTESLQSASARHWPQTFSGVQCGVAASQSESAWHAAGSMHLFPAQIRPSSQGSCSEAPSASQSAVVVQQTAVFLRFPSHAKTNKAPMTNTNTFMTRT